MRRRRYSVEEEGHADAPGGVLVFGTPETDAFPVIRRDLAALGYVEGRNIVSSIATRRVEPERLAQLASDLVRAKPDVIVAAVVISRRLPSARPPPYRS